MLDVCVEKLVSFFWFIVVTGGMVAFQGFVKPDLMKSLVEDGRQELYEEKVIKDTSSSPAASLMRRALNSSLKMVQKGIDATCKDCGIQVYDSETDGKMRSSTRVRVLRPQGEDSKPGNIHDKKVGKKHYVYRDGKYYEGVEKKIYYDKSGTPTLVIDNSQQRYALNEEGGEEVRRPGNNRRRGNSQRRQVRGAKKDGAFVNKNVPGGMKAYSPGSVKDTFETISKATANMKERDRNLKRIMQSQ